MPVTFLGLFLTLAFAVFRYGGVLEGDWNACLLALGALAISHTWFSRRRRAPSLDRLTRWLFFLFAALAVLQIVPLPITLVKVLSPARVELLTPLGLPGFTTLSATPERTAQGLLAFAAYVVVFLMTRDLTWRLERPWLAAWPLVAIASFEAGLGLVQSYTEEGVVARGTYINRNHFAGFLEIALPFAVMQAVAIVRRGQNRKESPAGPALRACGMLALAALILVGVLQSLSRMGFCATLIALFTLGVLSFGNEKRIWRRWRPAALLAVLALLGFVFLPTNALISRFASLAGPNEISADVRVQVWGDTWRLSRQFPLFGCGLGGYESCLLRYKTVAPMETADFAHNDYLQYLAELGWPAFLAGLLLVWRVYAHTWRPRRQTDEHYLAIACAASLTAMLVHSLVDFNTYIPANAMALAWIGGIAAASLVPRMEQSS